MSYTCPSSCTGTCPEIVPVTINQTILQLDSADVSFKREYKLGSDFTDNGDGTASYTLDDTPLIAKQLEVFVDTGAQGENSVAPMNNFSLSGDVLTLNFVPDAASNIQIQYWAAA